MARGKQRRKVMDEGGVKGGKVGTAAQGGKDALGSETRAEGGGGGGGSLCWRPFPWAFFVLVCIWTMGMGKVAMAAVPHLLLYRTRRQKGVDPFWPLDKRVHHV